MPGTPRSLSNGSESAQNSLPYESEVILEKLKREAKKREGNRFTEKCQKTWEAYGKEGMREG